MATADDSKTFFARRARDEKQWRAWRQRMQGAPAYNSWLGLHQRCGNPSGADYVNYGGRGITVCERWFSYANFIEDMGPPPGPGYSLDRIDVDGNYEPGNCRWATAKEQSLNRREALPHGFRQWDRERQEGFLRQKGEPQSGDRSRED